MLLQSSKNNSLIVFFILSLLSFSLYANIQISKMSPMGATTSLIGLLLLIYSFYINDAKYILLFFIWNWFLGPCSFINLYEYGSHTVGRLDYFTALGLVIYSTLKSSRFNKNTLLILLFVFINLIIFFKNKIEILNPFDIYYGYIGNVLAAYIIFLFLKDKKLDSAIGKYDLFFKILGFIFILNLVLAYIQLFFPNMHIRTNSTNAATWVFGVLLNRPMGVFGAAFRFSLSTLFLSYFIYLFTKERDKLKFNIFNSIFVLPLLFLSSSAVGLGISLYLINFYSNKIKLINKVKPLLLFLFLVGCSFILFYFSLSDLGKSTGTKFLVWRMIYDDLLYNSSFFDLLFGHGIGSVKLLSLNIPEFIANYKYGHILYDHEILTRDGFLLTHNIFLQTLYEFGLLLFLVIVIPTIRALSFVYRSTEFSALNMVFLASLINYNLHNGIFSVYYFLPLLLINHLIINEKNKVLINIPNKTRITT